MAARIQWKGPRVKKLVHDRAYANLVESGRTLRAGLVAAVSQPGPARSRPGQPPRMQSGKLRRSVRVEASRASLTLFAGSIVRYAGYLEKGTRFMKKRPWLARTFNRLRGAMAASWSRPA